MSIIYSNTCFWCPFFHCVWSILLFTLDDTLPSLCFLAVHGFSFIYISITIRILNQSWFTAQKVPEYGKIRTRKNSLFKLNTGKYGTEKIPYLVSFHTEFLNTMGYQRISGIPSLSFLYLYTIDLFTPYFTHAVSSLPKLDDQYFFLINWNCLIKQNSWKFINLLWLFNCMDVRMFQYYL